MSEDSFEKGYRNPWIGFLRTRLGNPGLWVALTLVGSGPLLAGTVPPCPEGCQFERASDEEAVGQGDESPETKRFAITPYRPNYFTINRDLDDAKFQISLQVEVYRPKFRPTIGLFVSYSQVSFWDFTLFSQPFRETNYNPEFFARWGSGVHAFKGWFVDHWQAGYEHESNGLGDERSRSWERLYVESALVRGSNTDRGSRIRVYARLWHVFARESTNLDIREFQGNFEVGGEWRRKRLKLALAGRLGSGGDRGNLEVNVEYRPWLDLAMNAFVQVFTGYGESLVDYNRKQSNVWFGVRFGLW